MNKFTGPPLDYLPGPLKDMVQTMALWTANRADQLARADALQSKALEILDGASWKAHRLLTLAELQRTFGGFAEAIWAAMIPPDRPEEWSRELSFVTWSLALPGYAVIDSRWVRNGEVWRLEKGRCWVLPDGTERYADLGDALVRAREVGSNTAPEGPAPAAAQQLPPEGGEKGEDLPF